MVNREDYTGQSNIKPDFLKRNNAKKSLKSAESAFVSTLKKEPKKIKYTGTGHQKTSEKNHRFSLKRTVPGLLIIALLGLGGFTIFNTNSLLGPHIEALYTTATDTQNAANVLRAEKLGFKLRYGRAGGFFDNAAEKTYKKLGLSRDIFHNFKQTSDDSADDTAYKKTMSDIYATDSDTKINTAEDRTVKEEDGSEKTVRQATGEDVNSRTVQGADASAKARSFIADTSRKVSSGVNVGCSLLRVGSMISVAVAANETYQSINYFMNRMEPISKMKAGLGNESGINQDLEWFTKAETSTIIDAKTGEEITTYGSPLQSEGARLILGGVQPNKSQANHFSLERLVQATILSAATTGATYKTCNIARGTAAAISLATLAVPGGGFVKALVGLLLDTTIGIGVQVAISGILAFFIPHVATALFSNVFETYVGKASGELFDRGASAANTRIARSSSAQMPSSSEGILNYNTVNNEVLSAEAAEDRKNRSPFDLTSGNTFLGSLARKFMVLNLQSDTSNLFNSLSTLALRSFNSTIGVFADGEDTSYMTTFGDCPNLEELGVKGDIYCNPITTTDLSTIDIQTDDPTYLEVISPNLELTDSGKIKIKDNSNLARFIVFCTERDSPFGVLDANIANAFEKSLGVIGDNLPVIGDVVDIVNAVEDSAAEDWATGAICVNSSKNSHWNSEMKYYQRYIEDSRLLSNENDTENPVLAFKDAYYDAHPLDNSRAGYLARISGLTKSDAEEVLAYIDYAQFVSEYNPSLAYNFNKKPTSTIHFESDHKIYAILSNKLSFNKVREVTIS